MTKFAACFLALTIMFIINTNNRNPLFDGVDGAYTFYLNSASSNAKIITVPSNEAAKTKKRLNDLEGESVAYSAEYDYEQKLIKRYNAVEIMRETVGFTTNVYYYSDKISTFVYIKGKKVNLHVAYAEDCKSVGIPFIFGGY